MDICMQSKSFVSNNGKVKFTTIEIQNTVCKEYGERIKTPETIGIDFLDNPWFGNTLPNSKMSDDLFDSISNHALIKGKDQEGKNYIVSFSFTRKAFYDKQWDSINTKARGLFVNKDSKEIVSRSYEKFFNLDENESHTLSKLKDTLQFPVTIFEKENGYLGIVGYDDVTDTLFISSKSTIGGDFAFKFNELFNAALTESQQDMIKRYLRDQKASLVFEVIDPVFDPHIIKYNDASIVLLDIIARDQKFNKAPYKVVRSFARIFNLKYKKKIAVFENFEKLEAFVKNVQNDDVKSPKHNSEGYVIEDDNLFCFKIKAPYYSFWKNIRSVKDRKLKSIEGGKEFSTTHHYKHPSAMFSEVFAWINNLDVDDLKKDIITLREQFFLDKE